MKRWMLACFAMLTMLLVVASPAAAAPGGNAAVAAACKGTGYLDYTDANGNAFKNAGQCTSYVARGGTLRPLALPSLTILVSDGFIVFSGSGLLPGSTISVDVVYLDGRVFNGDPVGTANVSGIVSGAVGYPCNGYTSFSLGGVAADGSPVRSATVPATC